MNTETAEIQPSIAGVPEEVQKNIVEDLKKEKDEVKSVRDTLKIGVSISENEDLARLGYSQIHLKDLMVEIVRSLLINDMIIVYGGDLRKEGYTQVFSDLAYQYRSIHETKKFYFQNYFAYPIYHQLTRSNELDFKKNRADIFKVSPPDELNDAPQKYISPDSVQNKYIWARSLSHMRRQMIEHTNGRILVGGKANNYLGKIPGVLEEAKITLQLDKPLYLVGAFGGCAAYTADAIAGKGFSFTDDKFHTSAPYLDFKAFYNEKETENPIDLSAEAAYFAGYGLDRLAANNGLSPEENRRLFVTPHLNEIIYLIFKGISKVIPV